MEDHTPGQEDTQVICAGGALCLQGEAGRGQSSVHVLNQLAVNTDI